jgi:RND family efflux transporter MFP subunit
MENNPAKVKKRSSYRTLIIVVVVVVLALAGVAGGRLWYNAIHPDAVVAEEAVNIRVTAAAIGEVEISSIYTGKLTAESEVSIVPKIPGKVISVDVALGDKVSAGDVLFRLETADVQLQVNQARIQHDAAKSAADSASSAVRAAESAVEVARNLPTVPDVSGGGFNLQGGTDPVAAAEAALAQTKAGYEQANVQYQLAAEGLNAANAALSNCTVTAPIDGYITSLNVQEGGMASQAMPSATVSNIDALQITTNVSENMIDNIAAGDAAAVYIRAVSEEPFAGVIRSVVPAPSAGTTTYPVVIELPNGDSRLKPGMFAEIRMTTDRAADAVVIPSDAVLIKTGREVVAVIGADDKVRLVQVETGLDNGSLVEVKSGLKDGDTVVYEGQHYLDEDSEFEIIE